MRGCILIETERRNHTSDTKGCTRSVTQIVEHLSRLSDADRLVVINAASSLMSDRRKARSMTVVEQGARLSAAALALKDYYENDEEVK